MEMGEAGDGPLRAPSCAAPAALKEDAERPLATVALSPSSVAAGNPVSFKANQPRRVVRQAIPDSILKNEKLNRAISESLPPNYSFEVPKTVWRITQLKATTVALQFPEGLLMYATTLSDLLEKFAGVKHCIILGDVAYGACCVDDITSSMLGAELLVHYGHSCLVPVSATVLPCLYVFVGITIDAPHLMATVQHNFPDASKTRLVLAGTIQFSSAVQQASAELVNRGYAVVVPQAKPLSSGEVLGCTAPRLTREALGLPEETTGRDCSFRVRQCEGDHNRQELADPRQAVLVFVADGRFHLEAMMIANPDLPAYRYDPFTRNLLREQYDHQGMRSCRRSAVETARSAEEWGVVLGTLGRQGNLRTLDYVRGLLTSASKRATVFLVSELSPAKVARLQGVIEAWVQIACPRLSIDWGDAFLVPVLTTYELSVALGKASEWWDTAEEAHERGGETLLALECGTERSTQHDKQAEGQTSSCSGQACTQSNCCNLRTAAVSKPYPMDYYASEGGPWNSAHKVSVMPRKV